MYMCILSTQLPYELHPQSGISALRKKVNNLKLQLHLKFKLN